MCGKKRAGEYPDSEPHSCSPSPSAAPTNRITDLREVEAWVQPGSSPCRPYLSCPHGGSSTAERAWGSTLSSLRSRVMEKGPKPPSNVVDESQCTLRGMVFRQELPS